MTKTAIIYACVSTAAQAEEVLPIESQLDVGGRTPPSSTPSCCASSSTPGISGRTDQRKAF